MSAFKAIEAFNGKAIGFTVAHPSVEIVVDPLPLQSHGSQFVLKGPLASDMEIDTAVNELIEQLEQVRESSKKTLKAYREKAQR